MRRRLPIAAFAALLVAAAGCGGAKRGTIPSGASQIPASASAVISIDTSRLERARPLLAKLADMKLPDLRSLGHEVDAVVLDFATDKNDVVALARPVAAAKAAALIAQNNGPTTSELLDGWTAYADNYPLIDRLKSERRAGSLAGSRDFRKAMRGLPPDAFVRAYLTESGLHHLLGSELGDVPTVGKFRWLAASAQARHNGVAFKADLSGVSLPTYTSQLTSRIPADAFAYVSFKGLAIGRAAPFLSVLIQEQLSPFVLGDSKVPRSVAGLFSREGALFLRPGKRDPEATLVLQEDDAQRALSTVDKLMRSPGVFADFHSLRPWIDVGSTSYPPLSAEKGNGFALSNGPQGINPVNPTDIGGLTESTSPRVTRETVQIAGITVRKVQRVQFNQTSLLYYAAIGNNLVLTTRADGIRDFLFAGRNTLGSSARFLAARGTAGMPLQTAGFAYVDFEKAVPGFRGFDNQLAPLKTLFVYATGQGSVKGFLAIK